MSLTLPSGEPVRATVLNLKSVTPVYGVDPACVCTVVWDESANTSASKLCTPNAACADGAIRPSASAVVTSSFPMRSIESNPPLPG